MYLNHGTVPDEVSPEVGDVLGKVANISNQRSLEAYLSFTQLVCSTLGLMREKTPTKKARYEYRHIRTTLSRGRYADRVGAKRFN